METLLIIAIFVILAVSAYFIFKSQSKQGINYADLSSQYVPRSDYAELKSQYDQKVEEVAALRQKLGGHQQLDSQVKLMEEKFESLSNKVIKESLKELKSGSAEKLTEIITPFNEQLRDFRKAVNDSRETSIRDSEALKNQISHLTNLNQTLSQEASNLTKALKADPKKRGNWGEILLETLLEKSGLVKNLHYRREVMGVSDEESIRADVIIDLPEKKNLVIDSKVTLNAYIEFSEENDPDLAQQHLDDHVKAVRKHISDLNRKRYDRIHNINSPEFVLMFMPIEPAFHFALKHDPELYSYAMQNNIVLVTASTLLAALHTVATIWQHDRQQKNVEQVTSLAGKLYDQVVAFVRDMSRIEGGISGAMDAYTSAAKRLSTGRNNVLRLTEKIKEMGANSKHKNDDTIEDFRDHHVLGA